jgi:hypothetical protein
MAAGDGDGEGDGVAVAVGLADRLGAVDATTAADGAVDASPDADGPVEPPQPARRIRIAVASAARA